MPRKRKLIEQKNRKATGRFTAEEKLKILKEVDGGELQVDVAARYGVHPVTLSRWVTAREEAIAKGDEEGLTGLTPRSTRPLSSVSPVDEKTQQLVIELKDEHPEMGPAQLRNQLRRFHGVSLSHKVIGRVLKRAGYELEKRVSDQEEKAIERFEMTRPNELWTMDIKEFYVHDMKVRLIDVIDDYSRFIVAHGLFAQTTAEHALGVLKEGISRHGKPDRVLSDRGTEFHAWQGLSAFTKFLEGQTIEHSLARPHHPQTIGKIEAFHATLNRELLGVVRFDSLSHAKRSLAQYIDHYNFERTHMGIGGVTPADRYFGRVEKGVIAIENQTGPIDRGRETQRLPGERAIVLQLALVEGRIELWFAGKRISLG